MILVEHPGCCGRKNTGPELGHPVKHRLSHFFCLCGLQQLVQGPGPSSLWSSVKWSYCRSWPQQVLSILEVSTADGLQLVRPLVCLCPPRSLPKSYSS